MGDKLNYNLNWGERFQIDNSSPSGLVKIKDYWGNVINKTNVGNQIFNRSGTPHCWRFEFERKKYCVHRVIWVMTYGSIDPNLVIDHLDGNPFNNSILNLELKTQKDNTRNRYKRFDNATGTTGVSCLLNRVGNKCYVAYWSELDGKRRYKSYSTLKFGEEIAKTLAINYRKQQIQRLILEGANYTDRHGINERGTL